MTDQLSPQQLDRQWTDLSCHAPETATAVYQYLLAEIAQQEERPNIEAHVEKATVRISYIDCRDREAWDMQLVGYRDGVESAAARVAALQAERDEARAAVGCVNDMLEVLNERAARLREEAVSDFKQRVAKRLRASGDEFGAPEYYAAADIIESLPAVDKEVVTDASSKEA